MSIATIATDIGQATSLLSGVSADAALLMTAYTMFKGIWMATNSGKTEADFLAYLRTSSQANVDDTTAYLAGRGYTQTAPGTWTKA